MRSLFAKCLLSVTLLTGGLLQSTTTFADASHVTTQAQQKEMTPDQAILNLVLGNLRFIRNDSRAYNYQSMIKQTALAQHPFAIILNCIDSRSVPEITFDQGIGNIFVTRIAANVTDKNVLAGMEFATKYAGAKLIVVMGHTNCGAIKSACMGVKGGNLTYLLSEINPAIAIIKQKQGEKFNCNDPKTTDAIAKENVHQQMQLILKNSAILQELVSQRKIKLVGAMNDLSSGQVVFLHD